jgi:hypothetical protein
VILLVASALGYLLVPSAMLGVVGMDGYLFASSLVDLYGFINQVVGIASLPSILLRVILGAVLVWLIPARNGRQP